MPDRVERLEQADEAALVELLEQDPIANLFLLGFADAQLMSRGWWYGAFDDDRLVGVVLLLPGRLAVPWCPESDDDAARLGDHLYALHRPSLLVGPRSQSDALWRRWSRGKAPSRSFDQRLYALQTPQPGADPPGFRRADHMDWPVVAELTAAMELEDLGTDRAADDPSLHDHVVKERIKAGRTWVIEEDGDIVFQVNIGTSHPLGAQIGGTFVPPHARCRGLATLGIAAIGRHLLSYTPRVILHVNEANTPAVRVYERNGYVSSTPFRLITP